MYRKTSTIVEKMGYKGHNLGPKEQGRKTPFSSSSYKYNRGLGYSPLPKATIMGVSTDPPSDVNNFDEEDSMNFPPNILMIFLMMPT